MFSLVGPSSRCLAAFRLAGLSRSRLHASNWSLSRSMATEPKRQELRLEPRKVLIEKFETSNKHFSMELLNQYDIDMVSRFGFMHIGLAQPLSLSLGCEPADMEILFYDQCKRAIDSGTSVVAFDKDERLRPYPEIPAGVTLVTTEELDPGNPSPPKEFHVRDDYGDAVDRCGYLRRNANRACVLMNELQSQFPYFLPPGVKKVSRLECICVRPERYKIGLAERMLAEAIKLAKDDGAEYMSAICLMSDLRAVCSQFNFKPYMDFSVVNFHDRGSIVFKPVNKDPSSSKLSLLIAKL